MAVTDSLAALLEKALDAARGEGLLPEDLAPTITFERPRRPEHGDWSTNVALAAASGRANPRTVAQDLVDRLPASDLVAHVEVAGPGFINFRLSPAWLHDVVGNAADASSGFGRSNEGRSERVNVEFVSSNPTGPMSVVSGRHAAVGDAIANLLEACGHEVEREFYVNDGGRQAHLFAKSVAARYLELHGKQAVIPEGGYQGDYVIDIAQTVDERVGDRLVEASEEERVGEILPLAIALMLEEMKASLARFGTTYNTWFSERSLRDSGEIERVLDLLRSRGFAEEREGALWFASSRLGDDKDRVLVRSNGEPTYLAADAAYVANKFGRGFDRLIYLWGPDHHGAVARMLAVAEACGFDRSAVEIPIVQVVTIARGAETLKGSKRAGVIVRLDDLVDEVGADAARYTFLRRSIDAPLDFDIELAKEQAPENPVYYVQYAHARICSILRRAESEGIRTPDVPATDLSLLGHESETALMRKLASCEEVVSMAAATRGPQRVTHYVEELASAFSAFYRDCRVVSDDEALTAARLALCIATRRVVADALGLLGVRAPESM